jgi:hypothetical protein
MFSEIRYLGSLSRDFGRQRISPYTCASSLVSSSFNQNREIRWSFITESSANQGQITKNQEGTRFSLLVLIDESSPEGRSAEEEN